MSWFERERSVPAFQRRSGAEADARRDESRSDTECGAPTVVDDARVVSWLQFVTQSMPVGGLAGPYGYLGGRAGPIEI